MSPPLVDVDRWRLWYHSRAGRRRWQAWARQHPALLAWQADELVSPRSSKRTDAMQAALVALAQGGSGEAAQTLLVQLRPGLIRLARWTAAAGFWSMEEANDEVRAVFYETLFRHCLQRRPRKIAANLVLDTRQRLERSERKSLRVRAAVTATVVPSADPASTLVALSTLRSAVERLPGSEASRNLTAVLAYRAWILEEPRGEIAADLGLGRQTISTRLHRLRTVIRTAPIDLVG